MNKIKSFFCVNKNYLYGSAFVALTSLIFIMLFFNKSLALQEGWYSIYARNIIENGLIPYKDFFIVVPPFALYVWTVIQYIFGDNFIVFHIADIFPKIAFSLCLYHIFTNFFSVRIAALSTLLSQVILIPL